jgi:TatD DNase family protein
MPLIDTHTHLFLKQFDNDRDAVVRRAIEAGVERMYLPNIDRDTVVAMNELAQQFPEHCFPMMGLHPCHVDNNYQAEIDFVEQELATGRYVAVGETGLDYHWDTTYKAQQQDALRQQIGLAKKHKLPIVLHTRESFDDTYRLIHECNDASLSGVFHCFGGTLEEALKVRELGGFYIGIGGVATFKKSNHAEVLPQLPLDMIVLETDAPYLAPVPFRGKRNESSYVAHVAARVAEIMSVPVEQVADTTSNNALKLYHNQ